MGLHIKSEKSKAERVEREINREARTTHLVDKDGERR
jgi:hypothetical protein